MHEQGEQVCSEEGRQLQDNKVERVAIGRFEVREATDTPSQKLALAST